MMLVSNYILWPIANALNAHLVPEEHRKVAGHIITVSGRPCIACCLTWPQEPALSLNILTDRFACYGWLTDWLHSVPRSYGMPGYRRCSAKQHC